ncbi:MAG: methylated-DNA--[protein]-cysteine S-methyltransferase [Clostridia bacterium]|nr:methylated-DNA--[protein]-cysteine S-methyltransferase [Clostridia bacterium]
MKRTQFERVIQTPVGKLTLCADEAGLCALRFGAQSGRADALPLLDQAQRELEEYFAGRRSVFSVPLSIHGTAFQERVWRALMEIPCGETITYGELARRVGNEKACRAVGMANHVNRIPIFIPCHRVVGANGKLTGYAGGLEIKRILLETEGVDVKV